MHQRINSWQQPWSNMQIIWSFSFFSQMEVLTDENINPSFKRVKYGIRGWLEDRTYEIRQELEKVSVIYLIEWKLNEIFPFHLNGFFDTKLVLGFVGSGKAFYWSSDSRWEPPRNGAASHYILQTGEVLFKRKMRKKRLYWPMNGRFIYMSIIFRNGWQCLLTWKEFMRHKIKLSSLKSVSCA